MLVGCPYFFPTQKFFSCDFRVSFQREPLFPGQIQALCNDEATEDEFVSYCILTILDYLYITVCLSKEYTSLYQTVFKSMIVSLPNEYHSTTHNVRYICLTTVLCLNPWLHVYYRALLVANPNLLQHHHQQNYHDSYSTARIKAKFVSWLHDVPTMRIVHVRD